MAPLCWDYDAHFLLWVFCLENIQFQATLCPNNIMMTSLLLLLVLGLSSCVFAEKCDGNLMDYYRCQKKIEGTQELSVCEKFEAVLRDCFVHYDDCMDEEEINDAKLDYMKEIVKLPLTDPAWVYMRKCSVIKVFKSQFFPHKFIIFMVHFFDF